MDRTALYDEDIYAWSEQQARILRGLDRARLPNGLDLDHVAEEIEDVGNEQRFAVESNVLQAMIHLIKIVSTPDDQAANHWRKETRAFLRTASLRFRPSMRKDIAVDQLWARACSDAREDLQEDGRDVPDLPPSCPLGLEDLVAQGASVNDLVERLTAAVAASRLKPR